MHIPDGMLHGAICPITLALGTGAVAASAYAVSKSKNKPSVMKFTAVTSAIFVLQMLNFPISQGTSGHFLGAAFAVWAIGTAPAILAMSLVIAIQAVIFGDGGLGALGANILVMGIAGVLSSSLVINLMKNTKTGTSDYIATGIGALVSTVIAAFSCSLILWVSGNAELKQLMTAMMGIHFKIGIGEAVISVLLMILTVSIGKMNKKTGITAAMLSGAAVLSSFASELPDGLEYSAEKLGFIKNASSFFNGIIPDYALPGISFPVANCLISASTGILLIFICSWLSEKAGEKLFKQKA